MSPVIRNLSGQVFGRLQVLSLDGRIRGGAAWMCLCTRCGNKTRKSTRQLTSGQTVSCGCKRKSHGGDRTRTHGDSQSLEHITWCGIRARCLNPNNKGFRYYGGRGITICSRWSASFSAFLEDMGRRPTPEHSVDRIDNNGGYDCGHCVDCFSRGRIKTNCRWATKREQGRNRRSNRYITYNNETKMLVEWAESASMTQAQLIYRLSLGWTLPKALNTPVKSRVKLTEDNVRYIRQSSEKNRVLAEKFGVSLSRISQVRLFECWTHVR